MNEGSREIFEQSSNAIPYAQVEWIEPATVNSVIDTQIKRSSKIEFEIVADKVFKTGTSSAQYMIGYDTYFAGDQSRKNCLFFGNGTARVAARYLCFGAENYAPGDNTPYPSGKATYVFKNRTYSENGVVKKTFSAKSFSTNANLYLLGINQPSSANYSGNLGCKMYSCKIWEDKVLVRDFIPVKHNGEGYMYDLCSKQLFGSISGSFIIGPRL